MSTFIEKLGAHGIDTQMALSRFAGDEALYEMCFNMLLEDPSFTALGTYITNKNYDEAFNAGHTLKGVTGNLELNAMYSVISAIVESLRSKQYDDLDTQYAAIMAEYEALKNL